MALEKKKMKAQQQDFFMAATRTSFASRILTAGILSCCLVNSRAAVEAPSIKPNAQGFLVATSATPGAIIRYKLETRQPTDDNDVWLAPADSAALFAGPRVVNLGHSERLPENN